MARMSLGELEDELVAACKHRDRARGAGHDKMESIHQKRIDQLETEIERRKVNQ